MEFVKYHGSGNDFLITETKPHAVAKLCHRRYGVGADGVLFWYKEGNGFRFHIYNADGSEAEMCGNGLRCVAHHIAQREGVQTLVVHSMHRSHLCRVDGARITVDLGAPKRSGDVLDTGVPHFVKEGRSLDDAPFLRRKYNANVTVCEFKDGVAHVRTFERGVEGETYSCGTGAAAAFVFLKEKYQIESVRCIFKSGDILDQKYENDTIFQTGTVTHVYSGALNSNLWYNSSQTLIGASHQ